MHIGPDPSVLSVEIQAMITLASVLPGRHKVHLDAVDLNPY